MKTITHQVQFCVIGGGLAGLCAAIEAARHGVKTLIMHERPMFGGNASSEIRMWVCGARHDRETGLVEEMLLENRYRNTYPNYSVWDSILYEKAKFQENLECLLNCSCMDAVTADGRIVSVRGWQMTTQQFHVVQADYFADCSGDSILAELSGAEYRVGREAKSEFGESLAQDSPDRKTMGMSCILEARETDSPKTFIPPAWASKFPDDASFPDRGHSMANQQNFWWLELGGDADSIADTETVRDDLLKDAFGLWDHIKNHGDHAAANWQLDWVGFLPGKRESRRCMGDYILTQSDVLAATPFEDIAAFGGWPVDDHHPGGFRHFGPPNTNIVPKQSYGIPLRCLYSRNIGNLLFAGRNISASHTALSSSRVMATCGLLGQAVGAVVAVAAANGNLPPRQACGDFREDIQQMLLDDDSWLLGKRRQVPALTLAAELTSSSGDAEVLRNGYDRPWGGAENSWRCAAGDSAGYRLPSAAHVSCIRLVFDSNLDDRPLNMVSNYYLNGVQFDSPKTLVRGFHILADGKEIFRETDNHQRLVKIPVDVTAQEITLVIDDVRDGQTRMFAFDIR